MLTNSKIIRIEWGDCDPAGIVYYPRYFEIFDACTHLLFERASGVTKFLMEKKYDMIGIPMVDTRARFMRSSRYGDDVTVETTATEFRRSSFDVKHRVLNDGQLAAEAFETRVWVGRDPGNPAKIKSQPIPDELLEKFRE